MAPKKILPTKAITKAKAMPMHTRTPVATKSIRTLEELLDEFDALEQVKFDAFKPEACTKAHANIP
jgi:hypothetical protein